MADNWVLRFHRNHITSFQRINYPSTTPRCQCERLVPHSSHFKLLAVNKDTARRMLIKFSAEYYFFPSRMIHSIYNESFKSFKEFRHASHIPRRTHHEITLKFRAYTPTIPFNLTDDRFTTLAQLHNRCSIKYLITQTRPA